METQARIAELERELAAAIKWMEMGERREKADCYKQGYAVRIAEAKRILCDKARAA